jgi:glycosyltransferase involved in cell wall biosynthesis
MNEDVMRIHIQLNYGLNANDYAKQYSAGNTSDLAPYGFDHARALEKHVTFSEDRPAGVLWTFVRRALKRLLGFDFLHALSNKEMIFAADIVWTMIDSDYLGVAALRLLTQRKTPAIIGNNVWLFEHFERFSTPRRWLYRRLIHHVDVLTVHSQEYLPVARRLFPHTRLELMHFGISRATFKRALPNINDIHTGPIRLLAPGNDPTRDWRTLFAAFGNDDRFDVLVISDFVPDAGVTKLRNVRIARKPTMIAFKDYYQWADFTVVPMVENKYSGITVALEAAAMECCLVSSRTGGVPTYFADDELLYFRPQDPDDLRRVVLSCSIDKRTLLARTAHERYLRSGYTTELMIARYHNLSHHILRFRY